MRRAGVDRATCVFVFDLVLRTDLHVVFVANFATGAFAHEFRSKISLTRAAGTISATRRATLCAPAESPSGSKGNLSCLVVAAARRANG